MAENRLAFHNGYRDKNGKTYNAKHNQRENFKKPKNADKNEYWDYHAWECGSESFSESEKTFYKYFFGDHVKAHNEKYKKNRQYARCMTVEQYQAKHAPEETLLYIGREDVDPEKLKTVFEDFREWLEKSCNTATCGIELLNAALHMDEATPHIHFRKVYWHLDKNGNCEISQTKALEELGYERPDTSKKSGRFNNVKQTFDAVCREKLFEIAKSHGVELTTEPLPKNEVGLSIDEYRAREQAREAWKAEQQALCAETEKAKRELKDVENERFENQKSIIEQKRELGRLGKFQEYLDNLDDLNDLDEQARENDMLYQFPALEQETYEDIIVWDDDDDDYFDEDEEKKQETQDARKDVQQALQSTIGNGVIQNHKTQTPVNEPARPLKNDDAKNNNARAIYNRLYEAAETMTPEEAIAELYK